MPFDIKKSGKKYKVVNTQTGRVLGTHASRAKAGRQLSIVRQKTGKK